MIPLTAVAEQAGAGDEMGFQGLNGVDTHPLHPFHQHLHGAVGQLQHLQHIGQAADVIQVVRTRLILGGRLLGHQQDGAVALHGQFQGLDGLGPPHEQGNHHVGEHHHIAQGQEGQLDRFGERGCAIGHVDALKSDVPS